MSCQGVDRFAELRVPSVVFSVMKQNDVDKTVSFEQVQSINWLDRQVLIKHTFTCVLNIWHKKLQQHLTLTKISLQT